MICRMWKNMSCPETSEKRRSFVAVFCGLLLFLFLGSLWGCTGGQRPDRSLRAVNASGEVTQAVIAFDYKLGAGDELLLTFLDAVAPTPTPYTLQPGDIMLGEFHSSEYLNRNFVVRPDGFITVPFVGDVLAAGKTVENLRAEVQDRLTRGGFLRDSPVTLSLMSFNVSYKQVQKLNSDGQMGYGRVLTVSVDGKIRLPLVGELVAGGRTVTDVEEDIQQAYSAEYPSSKVLLELKQVRSNLVYLLGYVNRPGAQNMQSPTTVSQAISLAGGFQETAGLDSVVVIHKGSDGKVLARLVNVGNILSKGDLSQDITLQRYDVVYVPPSTIHVLNEGILYGIRNMMPVHTTSVNAGFSYMWGPLNQQQ